jgi:acrylyl-CoA reductase (NADPH)
MRCTSPFERSLDREPQIHNSWHCSSTTPTDRRRAAWARLIHDLPRTALDRMMQVAPLEDVPKLSQEILQGRIRGRIVIDPNR